MGRYRSSQHHHHGVQAIGCNIASAPFMRPRSDPRGMKVGKKTQGVWGFPQMLPQQQVCAAVTQHALQPDIIEASKNELQHRSLAGPTSRKSNIDSVGHVFGYEAYIYLSLWAQGRGQQSLEVEMSCKSDKRATFQAVENWSWHRTSSQTVNCSVR